jgi:hypothetical protein
MARCGLRQVQGAGGLRDVLALSSRHKNVELLKGHLDSPYRQRAAIQT